MKTVSFDVWGTLLKSNPKFKIAQGNLAKSFTGCDPEDFLRRKSEMKKQLDEEVESTGNQPDRFKNYKKLFPELNLREINSFIEYSDKLFLKYPPIVIEEGKQNVDFYKNLGYVILISSNTVFIYGDVLSKIIWDEFEIPIQNCNFSDVVGSSKPSSEMFKFKVTPTFHIGDNSITDGSCGKVGINFINVYDANI